MWTGKLRIPILVWIAARVIKRTLWKCHMSRYLTKTGRSYHSKWLWNSHLTYICERISQIISCSATGCLPTVSIGIAKVCFLKNLKQWSFCFSKETTGQLSLKDMSLKDMQIFADDRHSGVTNAVGRHTACSTRTRIPNYTRLVLCEYGECYLKPTHLYCCDGRFLTKLIYWTPFHCTHYYDFDAVPGGGKRQDRWPNCGISARCYQEVVSSNPSYGHNADGIWKRADTDGSFTFDAAKCYQILIKVYRKNTC